MLIIAHRGASGEFPENTQIAFEQAIAQHADGIELDIQFHAESSSWWVMHDLYVDKTTNGQGQLQQLPSETLETLQTHDGNSILQLPQALAIIHSQSQASASVNATQLNIEVKISNGNTAALTETAEHLVTELTKAVAQGLCTWSQLLLSSFNHRFLAVIKQQQPNLTVGALIAHIPDNLAEAAQLLGAKSINPCIDCLNQELVDDAHQRGLAVWVYTVDRPQDIEFCHQIGVDAIFTNYPARSRKHLHAMSCTD